MVFPPHSKPTAYVAGRLGPWVAMVAADPNYSEPMIAWGDTEEVDVDSSRVTKFKGASGSSKLLLQCRRSRHVFGAVWSVVSVSQSERVRSVVGRSKPYYLTPTRAALRYYV